MGKSIVIKGKDLKEILDAPTRFLLHSSTLDDFIEVNRETVTTSIKEQSDYVIEYQGRVLIILSRLPG